MSSQEEYEVLMEAYVVTEWRDGMVWKTKSLGKRWVPMGSTAEGPERDAVRYAALSTDDPDAFTLPRRRQS